MKIETIEIMVNKNMGIVHHIKSLEIEMEYDDVIGVIEDGVKAIIESICCYEK